MEIKIGDYVKGKKVIEIYKDPFIGIDKVRVEGIETNWQGDKSDISYSINELKDEDIKKIQKIKIPLKLPSCNEYINACRNNKFAGAKMKKDVENSLAIYINKLPEFTKPVKIHFLWIEKTKKRDIDNVAFGKKFILDTMVKRHKLQNDNRNNVYAFTDEFLYGNENAVILTIEE